MKNVLVRQHATKDREENLQGGIEGFHEAVQSIIRTRDFFLRMRRRGKYPDCR